MDVYRNDYENYLRNLVIESKKKVEKNLILHHA